VPLIQAGLMQRASPDDHIISPCVTFQPTTSLDKSYTFTREHYRAVHAIYVRRGRRSRPPTARARRSGADARGSQIVLRKLDKDYDPTHAARRSILPHQVRQGRST